MSCYKRLTLKNPQQDLFSVSITLKIYKCSFVNLLKTTQDPNFRNTELSSSWKQQTKLIKIHSGTQFLYIFSSLPQSSFYIPVLICRLQYFSHDIYSLLQLHYKGGTQNDLKEEKLYSTPLNAENINTYIHCSKTDVCHQYLQFLKILFEKPCSLNAGIF